MPGNAAIGQFSKKDIIMWDQDPDILEALEEHDFEYETDDDFSDFEHEDDPEDATGDELLDEYSEYLDEDH